MGLVRAGSLLLEVSSILSLDEKSVRGLVECLLSVEGEAPYLVVEPTVVSARPLSGGPAKLIAVGQGSILLPGALRDPGNPICGLLEETRVYELARNEWVSTCSVRGSPKLRIPESCSGSAFEGTVIALDPQDLVASLINGLKGRHEICRLSGEEAKGMLVLAELEGAPVLVRDGPAYYALARSGELAKRIYYAASLVTSCSR